LFTARDEASDVGSLEERVFLGQAIIVGNSKL
jgi:hypothetical protein